MVGLSSAEERQETGVIENFISILAEHNLCKDINGWSRLPEDDPDFVLHTHNGDILLQISQIAEEDFAFPISKAEYNSGRYRRFIAQEPGEIPLAVDDARLNTTLKRIIQGKLEEPCMESDHEKHWLLIFSASAYPEIDCCVRGVKKDSESVSMARDYLKSHDPILFDQIWYSNPITIPVRIWPYYPDQTAACSI
jgi:hypothetical protein